MKTSEVRFWEVRKSRTKNVASWEIRWVVAGRQRSQSRRTKALAEAFLSELRQAATRGELFDADSGLPGSMLPTANGPTWLEFAQQYLDMKWPRAAAKSRDALTDALATITAALVREKAEPPDAHLLRMALRQHLLPPPARRYDLPLEIAEAVDWLVANSIRVRELEKARQLRRALEPSH
jgi:hypothetical protein